MNLITLERLRECDACEEWLKKFADAYPDGFMPTRENLLAALRTEFCKVMGWVFEVGEALDLRRADLRGADLSGADLSGADLSGADLSGADLSGADLSRSALRWANLSDANLSGANLRGADLSEAITTNAKGIAAQ